MKLAEYLAAGGRGALAAFSKKIEAHAPDVSRWASGERPVPAERSPDIEFGSDGQVTCEETNPLKPWRRIPDKSWPHPDGRPVLDFATAAKEAQQTGVTEDEITHE